jgi:UDP-2,4-diacetamido-2,4,6-trideoxy-beta-L-altropyranose hydrolase
MKVTFRVDASVAIGSGHVMRCMTLATALRDRGAQCQFICRAHNGNLIELLRQRGFDVVELTLRDGDGEGIVADTSAPAHANWLDCDWKADAVETRAVLQALQPDWLVIDHYALDRRWEAEVRCGELRLMVIDDLADRVHECELLLDQNLGRRAVDYAALVPTSCNLLIGPQHALLRPEFVSLREASLQRPRTSVASVLVNMGGVDQPNATGAVLRMLRQFELPRDCRISVVMGMRAPWTCQVRELAAAMPWRTEVLVNISNMAQRMAASDLAIGAAGSTSWERCCLGLPALMVVLASNQEQGAAALARAGAAELLGTVADLGATLPAAMFEMMAGERLVRMSRVAASLVDGRGVDKVVHALER